MSWKMMVVSLSSMYVILKIAFVCVLRSDSKVDLARYILSNISVNINSTCIKLISKCAERPHNHNTITFNYK